MSILASFKVYSSSVSISADRVFEVFRTTIEAKGSSSAAINILKGEGISYRRINMLEDFRRAGAITRVKDGNIKGQMKALDYFNKVVEPFRKENGLTNKGAWEQVHAWEDAQYKTVEEAQKIEGAAIKYGFGDTPNSSASREKMEDYANAYGYTI